MKNLWNNFKIAFAMYSKIPMPYADWNAKNMQYSMCFFPLIGIVIGALVTGVSLLFPLLPFQHDLRTVLYLIIPVLVTGGIHIDGFLDTCDALSSWQPVEKRLEILKDPHTGAFAIISAITYFLIAFGIWSEAGTTAIYILSVGFVMSRSFSGLSVVTFRLAKSSGLAATFSEAAKKQRVKVVMIIYLILCAVIMLWINVILGMAAILSALAMFFYYRRVCYQKFGGMTGDLAGYFLQLCELVMAIAVVLTENLLKIM